MSSSSAPTRSSSALTRSTRLVYIPRLGAKREKERKKKGEGLLLSTEKGREKEKKRKEKGREKEERGWVGHVSMCEWLGEDNVIFS
jgi:hypothetical protein